MTNKHTHTHIFTNIKSGSLKYITYVSIMSDYPASTKRFNGKVVRWIQPCYMFRHDVPFSVECPISFD